MSISDFIRITFKLSGNLEACNRKTSISKKSS